MSKKNIAVIFGGRSSENEISCMSVITIAKAINADKYDIYLIGITDKGRWVKVDSLEEIESGAWKNNSASAIISPDIKGELLVSESETTEHIKLDVIFPVLHGLYGEDGTIQGLFEMSGVPYVGCGHLASAVSMDKFYTKIIVDTLNVRQGKYVPVLGNQLDDMDGVVSRVEASLKYPVFIKPSRAGSSKGVSKAEDRATLITGIIEAAEHDSKILVEETIIGRELECAVLGYGKNTRASGIGEILAAPDVSFYDFDAKYFNGESKAVINPNLPEGKADEIRRNAIEIFNAVDGFGLSRVDFFLEEGTDEVVFNEINTLPGFTSISMYPMLWKDKGYTIEGLVEALIEMASER